MSDYLNKPATYDSAEVIEQARAEIRRRVAAREPGHTLAAHLQAAREDLATYVADLEQRNLISGTIRNYLQAALDMELEKARIAPDAADA